MERRNKTRPALFLLVFFFCISIAVPQGVFASGGSNFRIEVYFAKVVETVDTTQPATVSLTDPDTTSLVMGIPADVLSSGEAVNLTIISQSVDSMPTETPLPSGKSDAENFYNIVATKISDDSVVTLLSQAVTLTLGYTDADVSALIESTLKIYTWNGSTWVVLSDSSVDTGANIVTATTTHFSNFAILGDPAPVCGNSVVESGETCDAGSGHNGACPLTCSASCATQSCTSGGGGGGGVTITTPTANAIFEGRAYPSRTVTLLKDGQVAATVTAGTDARFSLTLNGLASGNYTFSLYAEDKDGVRSSLFSIPVFITSGASTDMSGIFIAPSISIDKSEVKRGDLLSIFGQSAPRSSVTISVHSGEEYLGKVTADANGVYAYRFDTSPLEVGEHATKSKAFLDRESSSYGTTVSFTVGLKNITTTPAASGTKGDVNSDGHVNLVDFSILAYWYKRPSPPATVDLNTDGKVDLVDFSIMAFYWTG